jgi:2,4-dienoyl-CoA reductase-like NADH-dependent reductase (Old Yellow Enzyme family)
LFGSRVPGVWWYIQAHWGELFKVPQELDILFTPLRIGNLVLRNRFVMPGMQRGFMSDGAPTPKMVDYMRRCAAGGVGLIISESTSPDHPSA